MVYSEEMQRFIKRKEKCYKSWLNQWKGKKREEIIVSVIKQKCEDRKVNEILEYFGYKKLTIDEKEKYFGKRKIITGKDWYDAIDELGKKYGVPVGEDTRGKKSE